MSSYVMDWELINPPYYWSKIGRYVLADRHLPDGTRQHIVTGYVPENTVVSNAQIFGEDKLKEMKQ